MQHRDRRRPSARKASGAGMLEAVFGLCLLITCSVSAMLLLENIGLTIYYKEKLGFIANQAALYAADQLAGNNSASQVQAQTQLIVDAMLKELGLPAATKLHVTAQDRFVVVTVGVDKLNLAGGGIFPASVNVEDKGIALLPGSY